MAATLPAASSPEFKVLWTALQQFVDNHDELDPGEPEPTDLVVAKGLLSEMDAEFAAFHGVLQ